MLYRILFVAFAYMFTTNSYAMSIEDQNYCDIDLPENGEQEYFLINAMYAGTFTKLAKTINIPGANEEGPYETVFEVKIFKEDLKRSAQGQKIPKRTLQIGDYELAEYRINGTKLIYKMRSTVGISSLLVHRIEVTFNEDFTDIQHFYVSQHASVNTFVTSPLNKIFYAECRFF